MAQRHRLVPENLFSRFMSEYEEPYDTKLKRLRSGILGGNLSYDLKNRLYQNLTRQIDKRYQDSQAPIRVRNVKSRPKKTNGQIPLGPIPPSLFGTTQQTSHNSSRATPNTFGATQATFGTTPQSLDVQPYGIQLDENGQIQMDQPQLYQSLGMSPPTSEVEDIDMEPRKHYAPIVKTRKYQKLTHKQAIAKALKNLRRMPDLIVSPPLARPGSKRRAISDEDGVHAKQHRGPDEWISILRPRNRAVQPTSEMQGIKRPNYFRQPNPKKIRTTEHLYARGTKRELENPRFRPSKYAKWETID
jgi:hypothetical protein